MSVGAVFAGMASLFAGPLVRVFGSFSFHLFEFGVFLYTLYLDVVL